MFVLPKIECLAEGDGPKLLSLPGAVCWAAVDISLVLTAWTLEGGSPLRACDSSTGQAVGSFFRRSSFRQAAEGSFLWTQRSPSGRAKWNAKAKLGFSVKDCSGIRDFSYQGGLGAEYCPHGLTSNLEKRDYKSMPNRSQLQLLSSKDKLQGRLHGSVG